MNEIIDSNIKKSENRKKNLKTIYRIIGLGIIFTTVNLGLFFDQIIMPKLLYILFLNNLSLTGSFQNFLIAIFLTSKIIFLILAGTYSDHLKTRIGNRLPLILVGLLIMAVSYFLIIFVAYLPNFTIWLTALYVFVGIGSALITIPGYALVVDLFKKEERGWAGMGIALF